MQDTRNDIPRFYKNSRIFYNLLSKFDVDISIFLCYDKNEQCAPLCSPTVAFRIDKHGKTARSILSNFLWYKKAGRARIPQLAYLSFPRRQARQNGEVRFEQFPMVSKSNVPRI